MTSTSSCRHGQKLRRPSELLAQPSFYCGALHTPVNAPHNELALGDSVELPGGVAVHYNHARVEVDFRNVRHQRAVHILRRGGGSGCALHPQNFNF